MREGGLDIQQGSYRSANPSLERPLPYILDPLVRSSSSTIRFTPSTRRSTSRFVITMSSCRVAERFISGRQQMSLGTSPVERQPARCADHRAVRGKGNDRPAMQQPDQP